LELLSVKSSPARRQDLLGYYDRWAALRPQISAGFVRGNFMSSVELGTTESGKRMHILDIMNQIIRVFLIVQDDDMYGEVLQILLNAMDSQYGLFGYINQHGNLVCPSMTRDIWHQCQIPDKDIVFPRDSWNGIWGKALLDKKTVYSNRAFSVPKGHIPISRAIDVPIIFGGNIVGNFLVGNKITDYNEDDCSLLENIANHIAPILDARLKKERAEAAFKQVNVTDQDN
jgi:hypothetical protein